jgi:hypothetical protein
MTVMVEVTVTPRRMANIEVIEVIHVRSKDTFERCILKSSSFKGKERKLKQSKAELQAKKENIIQNI